MKKPSIPSFVVFLALAFSLSPISFYYLRGQTIAQENQIRLKIRVVEWHKCAGSGTYPDGSKFDCAGLELYRFLMSDGTIRGPFFAIPVDKSFVQDGKWVRQSE